MLGDDIVEFWALPVQVEDTVHGVLHSRYARPNKAIRNELARCTQITPTTYVPSTAGYKRATKGKIIPHNHLHMRK